MGPLEDVCGSAGEKGRTEIELGEDRKGGFGTGSRLLLLLLDAGRRSLLEELAHDPGWSDASVL